VRGCFDPGQKQVDAAKAACANLVFSEGFIVSPAADPSKRQILANFGNRYVAFAPEGGRPISPAFDPQDSATFPRVADESEAAESRIVETLEIEGLKRLSIEAEPMDFADIAFADDEGRAIFIDVKVRESEPKHRDLDKATARIRAEASKGRDLQVWFFNVERLGLTVMRFDGPTLLFDQFVPINVWERTATGVFARQKVVDEVEDWIQRLAALYSNLTTWLQDHADLRFEQTRTVTMSEEMMHNFAVTDRELRILDIVREDNVVASLVPRGLWLIGAWGRVDLITESQTWIIVAIKTDDQYRWHIVPPDNRREQKVLDKDLFLQAMNLQ
jgi:hypothetical protein